MKKIDYLIIAICVIVGLLLGWQLARSQEKLFFEGWEVQEATITPQGLYQLIFKNPDQNAPIKSVVAIIRPDFLIIAYYYFENGEPKLFILEDGKYISKLATGCLECHKPPKKI